MSIFVLFQMMYYSITYLFTIIPISYIPLFYIDVILKFPELFHNLVLFESSIALFRKLKGIPVYLKYLYHHQIFKKLKSALESGLYNCTLFNNMHYFETFLYLYNNQS